MSVIYANSIAEADLNAGNFDRIDSLFMESSPSTVVEGRAGIPSGSSRPGFVDELGLQVPDSILNPTLNPTLNPDADPASAAVSTPASTPAPDQSPNPAPEQPLPVLVREAGTYARYYHQGAYNTMKNAYRRLFEQLEDMKLVPTGNAYEEYLIDEAATKDEREYVTKILIRVVPRIC